MGIVDSNYVSDHTLWMNDQMAGNPEWADTQKSGRAMWWDRKQTVEETSRFAEAKLAQKPYPYDVNFYGE